MMEDVRTVESVRDLVTPLGSTISIANVMMQLALPGVGRGVTDSTVDSGRADLHPVKRARTTGMYLAVAVFGADADRDYLREVVRRTHAQVVSPPGAATTYSANSPKLQLWVALCLLKYFVDQYEMLYGRLRDEEFARVLADGITLGTTLEVRSTDWPTTRAEYDELWESHLGDLAIDDDVAAYLHAIADLSILQVRLGPLGTVLHRALGDRIEFINRGALPGPFRDMLGYRWTGEDAAAFRRYRRAMRMLDELTSGLWQIPWYVLLWDMRVRRRLGLRVI